MFFIFYFYYLFIFFDFFFFFVVSQEILFIYFLFRQNTTQHIHLLMGRKKIENCYKATLSIHATSFILFIQGRQEKNKS